MSGWYILDDENKLVPATVDEYSAWRERHPDKWRVGLYEIPGAQVSTVFLGSDHGFGTQVGVLWETLVFGGPLDQEMGRYTSYEAAKVGHEHWSTRVYSCLVSG